MLLLESDDNSNENLQDSNNKNQPNMFVCKTILVIKTLHKSNSPVEGGIVKKS